jgi:hypothetical protein
MQSDQKRVPRNIIAAPFLARARPCIGCNAHRQRRSTTGPASLPHAGPLRIAPCPAPQVPDVKK